ncbi:MAG TPA: HD domain-containing protein [Longimicrobiales bacterium]|nr:HD domain-containing protein [Longimicrobiales bacterium]
MTPGEIRQVVEFLHGAEALKNVTRNSWTSEGRRESVAEHTWRLCLMAMLLEDAFPDVDFARLVKICIVHDLGEAIGGDISAKLQTGSKAAAERQDLLALLTPLPAAQRVEIVALWDEYEDAASPEARVAKALDKIETILQHNQGRNPPDFDYAFNLEYGRRYTAGDPVIEVLRAIADEGTRNRASEP